MTDFRVETKGVSGSSSSINISQTAHGFTVGQVVYYTGSAYALARADIAATAEVIGIVSTVSNANAFTITTEGYVIGLTGLTAGSVYFLSPSSAGLLTTTEPSTVGQVSKPLLIADSTTSGYFFNFRGEIIGGATNPKVLIDTYAYTFAGGF